MIKKAAKLILPVIFWLGVWQIMAIYFNNTFLLPDIQSTIKALLALLSTSEFWPNVGLTLLRVLSGLTLGVITGTVFAFLSHRSKIIRSVLTPIVSVIKSTPVASFIIILWIVMSGDALSIFVSFLMVMPIIWQNLMDGYDSIDKELVEVCEVFELNYTKKLRVLIFPALIKYFIPAFITSVGLAWKSEIAAEIIAYTENSIGHAINDSKMEFDSPTVFAWTLVVILLSIVLERLTKIILRRIKL